MMGDKNSFVLYTSYLEQVTLLSDEQAGVLLKAILHYVAADDLPKMDGMTAMAFSFIKAGIDKDTAKYQMICEARSEAGKKGGRPSRVDSVEEKQTKAKKANGFSEKQTIAKKADNDNEYDSDNEDDLKENILFSAKALFERLWALYPEKKGKGKVSDAQKKRLLAVGEPALVKAIERYSTELQKDADWRKPQNGSTFFNSGYVDYLDENYKPSEKMTCTEKNNHANRFNNFNQRQNDYDDLVFGEIRRRSGEPNTGKDL